GLVAIFYLLSIFFEQETWQKKLRQFAQFLLPIFFCGLVILSYNYLRFSNPLTTGYKLTWFNQHYYAFSTDGQFNLKYIPTNLYYYFLESFRPNYLPVLPGQNTHQLAFPYIVPYQRGSLSFFIISPLFLLLFKADYRKKINKQLLATAFIILFILLCYYYNGHYQIGPRYFNDFLPLLFIILLSYFQNKEFNDYYKLIIIISIFLNFYIGVYLLANTDLLRI
ncbi:MAG: hypothetical protein NT116_02140, partial [Candidatus Parcubacteria bacterium]|nr:hypothetical protein [Candidatus Parcubacteria bacterium]